jgi:hypothetical protein
MASSFGPKGGFTVSLIMQVDLTKSRYSYPAAFRMAPMFFITFSTCSVIPPTDYFIRNRIHRHLPGNKKHSVDLEELSLLY